MKREIIIMHESVKESMLKDSYSLGLLIIVMLVNYFIADNNWTINVFGAFCAAAYLLTGKSGVATTVYSSQELLKFAENMVAVDNLVEHLKKEIEKVDKEAQ